MAAKRKNVWAENHGEAESSNHQGKPLNRPRKPIHGKQDDEQPTERHHCRFRETSQPEDDPEQNSRRIRLSSPAGETVAKSESQKHEGGHTKVGRNLAESNRLQRSPQK